MSLSGYYPAGWYAERSSDSKRYFTNGNTFGWYSPGHQPSGYYEFLIPPNYSAYSWSGVNGDIIYMFGTWTPYQYTLSFNSNVSGQGSMDDMYGYTNQHINIPANGFTYDDHCLNFWAARSIEDNSYYCTDGDDYNWLTVNNINNGNQGYQIIHFEDKGQFSCIPESDNMEIELVAYWIPNYMITKGDVNRDGSITISDVTMIQYYIAELTDFTEVQFYAADMNNDGEITIADSTILQNMI